MGNIYKSVFSEEFDAYIILRKAELSNDAFRHCKRTVKIFDDYLCKRNHTKKEVTEYIVEEWIKEISKDRSLNTTCQYVNYIRHLLLHLRSIGYSCFVPKTVRSKDTYIPYLYSDKDIERIIIAVDSLKAPRAVKNVYIEKEMPLLVRLLLCCGLRVGEALMIKVGDIDFQRNLIILRVTKKYKQRMVPYDEQLANIIYHYCAAMELLGDSEAYLFPTVDKDIPLSPNSARNYFKEVLHDAGFQRTVTSRYARDACLHCFRHTFAVRSFDKNDRNGTTPFEHVPFLSTYLGHDSLYETEKYLKYSGNYFSDTLSKFEQYAGDLFPEVIIHE